MCVQIQIIPVLFYSSALECNPVSIQQTNMILHIPPYFFAACEALSSIEVVSAPARCTLFVDAGEASLAFGVHLCS